MSEDPAVEKAVRYTIDNWDELGVLEGDGVLHLPAAIKRRTAKGTIHAQPVLLRNVTHDHRHKARHKAREYAKTISLDIDRDKDLVQELENYQILVYAIRDPKTFIQHAADLDTLLAHYEAQELAELWGRYNAWVAMLDPRYGELDAEQLWQVIARVAREKTPLPLADLGTPDQFTCIVAMAVAALSSATAPSWLRP